MIEPMGTSPFIVIGTAINAQLNTQTLKHVFNSTHIQTPLLDQAFSLLEQDAQQLGINSTELITSQLVGQLIDVLG